MRTTWATVTGNSESSVSAWDVGHPAPGPGRRGAQHLDGAGDGVDEAEDRLDQRALPRAVGSDEGQRPAGGHLAGDALQHRPAAVGHADVGEPPRRTATVPRRGG